MQQNRTLSHVALLVLGAVFLAGCGASKNFVRTEIAPLEDRLAALESDVTTASTRGLDNQSRLDDLHRRLAAQRDTESMPSFDLMEVVHVQFPFDSAELTDDARSKLDALSERLSDRRSAVLLVRGHTDATGSPRYNLKLSEERASAVSRHLALELKRPIPVSTLGLGKRQPVADPVAENAGASSRAQNRRVEIAVLVPVEAETRTGSR